ncbi:MAG: germination protein YpeB [Clostridium sp.]|uniref:germination protein YpeB n=1 Tax=Clostridium sp. TaxID=1506 RepID=UPI0039EC572F
MNTTKKRIIYTIAVALIVVFSTTFAILMTLERIDYRNYLMGEYSKSMYQLINSVENIGSNLAKVPVLGSKDQDIVALEEIFRYSSIANDKLHSLPIDEQQLSGTSKFITQVGDFCYTLANKTTQGVELSDEDIAKVETLKKQAYTLENQLKNVQNDINNGDVKWGEIRKKASGVLLSSNENAVSTSFESIQKQIVQYPSLIYDGPFSDNNLDINPKINSSKDVTAAEAEGVVRKAIGNERIESIERQEDVNKQKIPCYSFNVNIKGRKNDNKVSCEITKKGGMIYYILDNRNIDKPTIDVNKAQDIGSKYLADMAYTNMTPTYSLVYNNTAIVSYIYNIGNVAVYTDQIKLKIALDNGNIIGMESAKYLTAHDRERKIPDENSLISKDKAQEKVSKRLDVTSSRLAIVPTESNKEVLCYEFVGNYNGDSFIVYINAQTGYEVRILQIRNTPNGKLTI